MTNDPIYPRTFKETEKILSRRMDIIRSCVAGDNMDILSVEGREGLKGMILICEASSGAVLMVMGGVWYGM